MSRIDIMCDLETLGRKEDSTIIQIAAIAFNIYNGKELNVFNKNVDVKKCENINIEGSTLKWWIKSDKDLFFKLIIEGTLSDKELLSEFYEWICNLKLQYDEVFLWGNGILFDNKILQHQFESIGLKYPIFYRNDRDMRTLVELAAVKEGLKSEFEYREKYKLKNLRKHDAFDDVKQQISIIIKATKDILSIKNKEVDS